MKKIAVLLLSFSLIGCVSALIDNSSGRFKNVFVPKATTESVRESVGLPEYTYTKGEIKDLPKYSIPSYHSYDVFDVTGKIHKPGDGAVQATVSAISLGIGELFLLPFTAVKITKEYMESHTLVVFYNETGNYIKHQLYDSDGKWESVSGY